MTSPNHHRHLQHSSIRILAPDKNNERVSPHSWVTASSSRSFSFSKIPPANPSFFSKTSMIQMGYGLWINMTTLVTGLAIGFTAIALPQIQHEDSKINITFSQEGWIASFLTLCVPFGSLLGGILMDVYGRQPVIVLCGIPVSLGWLFIGLAKTLNTFIIGCVIISVGLGMMLTAPRAYITEITLPNMRGVLGAMPYFFLSVGFVTVATLVVFIEWQTISYICGIYSIVLMIFNCYLPETPHFVLLSSPEKAIENLRRFRSKSFDVENEMEMLLEYRNENDIRRLSLGEAIVTMWRPSVCKPFAISLTYILLMLCSGCVVVIMWTVEMLELSNTAIGSSTGNLIISISRIVVGIMTSAILYKAKRRVMAVISAAGVGCSAIGISIYLHTQVGRHITPFYFYVAYISFAVLGYYTLPLITMYEILPLQLRGVLSGINITLMNLIIIGMNTGYPHVREAIGLANLMAIFGGISLIGTIILYYILPETSEVTLQEIEEYFGNKRPTLVSSRIIRSDQLISMMKASSSQAQPEELRKTSIKLRKKKSREKLKKIQNSKETSIDKESERNNDKGGSKDNISDRDKDMGGSKNKISKNDKHIGALQDKISDGNNRPGSSIVSFKDKDQGSHNSIASDRHKDRVGSEDKLFDKGKDKNNLQNEITDKDKEGSVNKESDRDTDQGGLTNKTFDKDKDQIRLNDIISTTHKHQDGSKNEIYDRDNDQSSSKDKTPHSYKDEEDSKDKELVRIRDLINKKSDKDTKQGDLTDKKFDGDENQNSSKDKTSERKKDEEDAKNKEYARVGGLINKKAEQGTEQGGLTDKTFDKHKDQKSSNDIISDRHKNRGGSKDEIYNRDTNQSSSKDKTPHSYKDEGDAKDKESVRIRGLINKEADQNTEQGSLTDKTFNGDKDQGSSKDNTRKTPERKKDEDAAKDTDLSSSKDKTPHSYKDEGDAKDKESVRIRGLINKEADQNTEQGGLTDKTFNGDKDQGSSKDNTRKTSERKKDEDDAKDK